MILILILLGITIILQLIAMVVALRLTRATKFNISWILFIVALSTITLQRLDQFLVILNAKIGTKWLLKIPEQLDVWIGIVISLCVTFSLLFIKKLFNYIQTNELKRQNNERQILKAVIDAEERQRSLLAKELHDDLGPLLSTALMSLSAINSNDEFQQKVINNAQNAISLAVFSLRNTSNTISSHVLDNFGLAKAISNAVKNMVLPNNVKVEFNHNIEDKRFQYDYELSIYRICTELLNNTLKHANAKNVQLNILCTNTNLKILYADDGNGFKPESNSSLGMGLNNITSRVKVMEGSMKISSEIDGGTHFEINFKLP